MPELPEVLTIKKDLHKEIIGKTIVKVDLIQKYPLTQPFNKIESTLNNQKVVKISNIAKLITIKLTNQNYLAIHLNMSGRLLYNVTDPYIKITLHFNTGDKLHFSSVRMFETFKIMTTQEREKYKKQYGPSIISKKITPTDFEQIMKKNNTYIKNNLLNQRLVSGIGNIYATDALYLSKINPKTKSHKITKAKYTELFNNLQMLIKEGIKHRGSTIDRYTDIYKKPGSHQKYFRIYGKKNQNCLNCGQKIVFEALQGRGNYYCSICQPIDKKEQKSLFA